MRQVKRKRLSISIDPDIMERIELEAIKENRLSSEIASSIIKTYATWRTVNNDFIPIRKAFLLRLLEKFSHEEIDMLAKNMAFAQNKITVLRHKKKFDINSALDMIDDWLRLTNFPYSHTVNKKEHRFVVLHGMGIKISIYLIRLFSTSINQLGFVPNIDYNDKIFSITIDLKRTIESEEELTNQQISILKESITKIDDVK
ncbi:MAG: hypothetical protein ABI340_08605 [Nitrososphaera sp.]|jgi:hypothetical protein